MADRYLLESGAGDGYLLEDGSGVLLLDAPDPNAIAVDSTSSSGWDVFSPSSLSWSHTCSGADRVLIVAAFAQGNASPNEQCSATYNSVAGTLVAFSDCDPSGIGINPWRLSIFAWTAPSTGSNTILVTFIGANNAAIGTALSLNNASQSLVFDQTITGIFSNTPVSGTSENRTTTKNGTLFVDAVVVNIGAVVAGALQTEVQEIPAGIDYVSAMSYEPVPSAGGVTMSWTWTSGAFVHAGLGVMQVTPPAAVIHMAPYIASNSRW